MKRKLFGTIQKMKASSEMEPKRERETILSALSKDKARISDIFRLPSIKDVLPDDKTSQGAIEKRSLNGQNSDDQSRSKSVPKLRNHL